jgi:hypothetical protein
MKTVASAQADISPRFGWRWRSFSTTGVNMMAARLCFGLYAENQWAGRVTGPCYLCHKNLDNW